MEFLYTAINKDGKTEKDSIDAASYHDAISILHGRGLIPTGVKTKKEDLAARFLNKISGVSLQDKILFIKNLSIMLRAGISLSKALKILASQTSNGKFRGILEEVHQDVEAGKSFAEALARSPEVFTNIFVSMVRVGELSGNLDKALEYLGVQLAREHNLIAKTRGAMIYPAVIVFAVIVVGVLLSIFVLPNLISVFKESKIELPFTTRMVIAIVDFMSGHTLIAIILILGFFSGIFALYKTAGGRRFFDIVILKTPIISGIVKKVNMARFARIMNSMLKSGTPILEGLQVASDSLGNSQYREAIKKAAQDVKVGKAFGVSLAASPKLFSYLVTQMIQVGEESGTVDTILEEIAIHYEEEVDETMANLSSVIEPVLILFIGGAVGVLALALISPIYSLTSQAGG